MACYTGFGLALARLIWTRGPTRLIALAIALTAAEWLRGHLFSGFPWNVYGYALTGPLVLAQGAALIGIWGLTFVAVAVFASPAVLTDDRTDTRRPWLPLALGVVLLAALAGYGAVRLNRTPTAFVDKVRLRIMQPNLQQDEKFNYSAKQKVMSHYLELSDRSTGPQSAGVRDVTHLIWPESAFPFLLTREPDALAQIAALLPEGTVLITGAVRAPEAPPGQQIQRAYNSIYVIDHDGSILSVYDKIHLVPFGEYLPFQNFLESLGLMQLTKLPGGFIAGERRRVMDVPRAPRMLPFLCYEIIFPGEAMPERRAAGLADQSHQRRLVRHQHRALPASATGARAHHRTGTAAGARRQHRHLGGDRSGRPHRQIAAARRRGRDGRAAAASDRCAALCADRRRRRGAGHRRRLDHDRPPPGQARLKFIITDHARGARGLCPGNAAIFSAIGDIGCVPHNWPARAQRLLQIKPIWWQLSPSLECGNGACNSRIAHGIDL